MSLDHRLAVAFLESRPTEAALALERMRPEQRASVVESAPASAAVQAVRALLPSIAAQCLTQVPIEQAAAILDALDVDTSSAILRRLRLEARAPLLHALPASGREAIARMLQYPEGTAGALMDPKATALPDDISVTDARLRIRRAADGLLYYLYVVSRDGRLVGVLDVAELMQARAGDPLRAVMHTPVDRLTAWTPAAGIRVHPGWRSFHAMPVVDESGRFLGAIRYQTLRRLEQEAEASTAIHPTGATAVALGELFHLGIAGFVEGLSAAAVPRRRPAAAASATRKPETRDE